MISVQFVESILVKVILLTWIDTGHIVAVATYVLPQRKLRVGPNYPQVVVLVDRDHGHGHRRRTHCISSDGAYHWAT